MIASCCVALALRVVLISRMADSRSFGSSLAPFPFDRYSSTFRWPVCVKINRLSIDDKFCKKKKKSYQIQPLSVKAFYQGRLSHWSLHHDQPKIQHIIYLLWKHGFFNFALPVYVKSDKITSLSSKMKSCLTCIGLSIDASSIFN